ncbi:type II toxin-antitoxin system VapC family toxin [Coleofasciculus chthonoplastes]|jgi:predicted nucleic acid-binding protein|uniref:type II toxin-antitoxin system VapC family toxin n=1 Tax=Coleofasciculus chthonoplastes TaxID=64178 RepID=UPI0032F3DF4E
MTYTPLRCVVDASVAIKLFVDDPLSDKVDTLFSHLDADPMCKFYVPDLFYIECTNIDPDSKTDPDLGELGKNRQVKALIKQVRRQP